VDYIQQVKDEFIKKFPAGNFCYAGCVGEIEDHQRDLDEVWQFIQSKLKGCRDEWCHKLTPEGIIVRPHCRHNLTNKVDTFPSQPESEVK